MATIEKKRKMVYKEPEFKEEWTENFAFILNSEGRPTCLICNESYKCNIKHNIDRHFTMNHRDFRDKYQDVGAMKKAILELKRKREAPSDFNNWVPSSETINAASFAVSLEIFQRGKPYTDGEYIHSCFISAFRELLPDNKVIEKKIREIPLSAEKVKENVEKASANVTSQLINDLKSASTVSILVNESCNVNDEAQVSLFVRFVSSEGPKEELFGLLPLKRQARGLDIANVVIEYFEAHKIPLGKIFSISTDGAKSMIDKRDEFVACMKEKIKHEILSYYCINHQEALYAQIFPEDICKVMEMVIKITNFIVANALPSHCQFKDFITEVKNEYKDLLLPNMVPWLSRGNVLKLFASLFTEIKSFLLEKGVHYEDLTNDYWIQKLYFMVDVTPYLNQLNIKLQKRGNITFSMLQEMNLFENKLLLFANDIQSEKLSYFPCLREYCEKNNSTSDISYFRTTLLKMREVFVSSFKDLTNFKATLAFVKNPFNARVTEPKFSLFNINIEKFKLQLLDLENKESWSSKFKSLIAELEQLENNKCELSLEHESSVLNNLDREDELIFNYWNKIPDTYDELKKLSFGILSLFGSTYLCEQSISSTNLSDENLESRIKLKTTTYKPVYSKEMPGRCSKKGDVRCYFMRTN